jgi:hypothetical protein
MVGLSYDVGVAIHFLSIVLGLLGAVIVARCGGEIAQKLGGFLWRLARRPKLSLRRAVKANAAGHVERAHRLLAELLRRVPDHYEANLAMWQIASDSGHPEQADAAMLRVIRHDVQAGNGARAVQHWLELRSQGLRETRPEPALLVRLGGLLERENRFPEARGVLEAALRCSNDAELAEIASRVAGAAIDLDPAMAEEAAWRALACENLDLGVRLGLQRLLQRLYPAQQGPQPLELEVGRGAAAA